MIRLRRGSIGLARQQQRVSGCRAVSIAYTKDSHAIPNYARSALQANEFLLAALSDDDYTRKLPKFYAASPGSHFRHILDHFECCLNYGADNHARGEAIDYDQRERNTLVEESRAAAIKKNAQLLARIDDARCEAPALVRFMHTALDGSSFTCPSSVGRELAFAAHHATHHHAVVKLMMAEMGRDTAGLAQVGMAVSTLHSALHS